MISALKITADRMAELGECRFITFSLSSCGKMPANMAGRIAKYFARSLATLNVVRAPRVISICLPISTISMSLVGSDLIGSDPVAADPNADPWFHTRPSAVALDLDGDGSADVLGPADPSISMGSNKGAFDEDLVAAIGQRKQAIAEREGVEPDQVPADAVTASGSGLDPHISPAYAELQVPRVARVTGVAEDRIRSLIDEHTDGRGLGVLGEPGVNVLDLNLAVQAAAR